MIVKIGDVISEYSVRNKFDENIPVYSVTNEKGFCTGYFSKEVASKDKSTYKIVPRGYFAYNPSRINVGSVDWQKYEDRVIVSPLYVVFGVSDRLDRQYLLHYLKSDMMLSFIKEYATGSVRDNLKLADLGKFPINLRPVEEQRQIATTLDKIDDLIAKRRQQLDKLDELVKSRFIEMFGEPENNNKAWPVKSLDKLCTVGSSKRVYQSEQSSEGVPFWRISDLVSKIDTGTVDSALFISEIKYTELKRAGLVPVTGDILVTSRGTLGRCYIIQDEDCFYFQDGMISWLSNYSEEITPLYLQYLFTMSGFRKQIDNTQAGSTVAYLSIAMLKKLQVMVPDKALQEQFAAFVAQTDKSKYRQEKCIGFFQCLEKSIRQEWL